MCGTAVPEEMVRTTRQMGDPLILGTNNGLREKVAREVAAIHLTTVTVKGGSAADIEVGVE